MKKEEYEKLAKVSFKRHEKVVHEAFAQLDVVQRGGGVKKEEYEKLAKVSFKRHEKVVHEAFAQLDVVQNMVAEIRADLEAGPTKKPKVNFTVSQGYSTARCFIKLKSGSIKVGLGEQILVQFLETGDLGHYYGGTYLDSAVYELFQDRFDKATDELYSIQDVSIDRTAFLWGVVSRERAKEVLKAALNMLKLEDVDSTEKQLMHERRILFDRVRRVLKDTCDDGQYEEGRPVPSRDVLVQTLDKLAEEGRPVPSRDVLVQTLLGSTAHRDPFSNYYRRHINPWVNMEKTKFKYAQVDYELNQEDAEQLADEILVEKVMGA